MFSANRRRVSLRLLDSNVGQKSKHHFCRLQRQGAAICLATHYPQLNVLQDKYKEHLQIFGFPCNQFGLFNLNLYKKQEPGGNPEEIINGIKYVRPGKGFVPNFILTKKIEVNGKNQESVFAFLKKSCPSTRDTFSNKARLYYDPLHSRDIKWNWEKFLIEPFTGTPFRRYDASHEPKDFENDIQLLVSKRMEKLAANGNNSTNGTQTPNYGMASQL
ncbi:glutathione peroxidase-like protein [Leptotrombidium deliense]|uniref:Glutathione peroxidase-like protein n=1 Tax=Leptotrombidium deliense TaxID=299467 RepID=A0A443SJ94_9ACAR|nr:glutathione peroxidase-like protein [Leptotrombidium deliense]